MNSIIRYTIITALRDWLLLGLILMIVAAYGMSVFMGSTALVEQQEMALAYFAGSSRIIMVIGMVVFVCFHVRRLFDNREIELLLSKPISKIKFIIAYWLGLSLISFVVIAPVILIFMSLFKASSFGLFLWTSSVLCEIFLIIGFAMLASLIMRSAVSAVMSSFAFYLVCRLMGFFSAALMADHNMLASGTIGHYMSYIIKPISVMVPRLDLFAKSSWLIYGTEPGTDIWVYPVQTFVFAGVILSIAIFDFLRKEF